MNKTTKIVLAAGALAFAGAAGAATFAVAEYRGEGWHGKHHGFNSSHGRWHAGHRKRGLGYAHLMERFDSDQDGKLDQDELNKSRTQLLEKHDADKNSELSLTEFEKLWTEVMHQRMVRGFQRIDKDGNANITLDEFLKPYANMVERLDRNDDGRLDQKDRRHGRMHHKHGGQMQDENKMHEKGKPGDRS